MSRPRCLIWPIVLAVAAATAAAQPSTTLTVAELDHLLADMHPSTDRSVASQLAAVKLTERATTAQLERWEAEFTGSRAREALIAVADASAFLRPPLVEIPAEAAPNEQTLKQIRARMMEYVENILPKLPNFVAQRSTTAFAITTSDALLSQQQTSQILQSPGEKHSRLSGYHALGPAKSSGLPDGQLFWMGSFSQSVTYRDGAEVADSSAQSIIKAAHLGIALTSSGEFGSILEVLLTDAAPEQIIWDHWERSASGPLAVFRYTVPHERSHFAVNFSEDRQPDYPAYHGEITADPSSGVIYRITITAYTHDPDMAYSSYLAVEFGPTQIGGKTYVCPARGIAITKILSPYADPNAKPPPVATRTSINDVSFTNYHVFRSVSRVLSGTPNP